MRKIWGGGDWGGGGGELVEWGSEDTWIVEWKG